MNTCAKPGWPRSWWRTAARFGQTAWFFGNLYEGLVGMPQLLADARAQRAARLIGPGSPIRYYAPAAPLALGATTVTLVQSWQSDGDWRRMVATWHRTNAVRLVALAVASASLSRVTSRRS